MGLRDSMRRLLRPMPAMRDRGADRDAGSDPKFGGSTPTGTAGPAGATLDKAQGAGGAIEPDPPADSS